MAPGSLVPTYFTSHLPNQRHTEKTSTEHRTSRTSIGSEIHTHGSPSILLGQDDSNDRHVIIGSLILARLQPSPRRQRSIHAQQRGTGRLHSVNSGYFASFLHSYGSISAGTQARGYGSLRPGHVDVDPKPILFFFETLEEGRSSVTRGKQADSQDDDEGCV